MISRNFPSCKNQTSRLNKIEKLNEEMQWDMDIPQGPVIYFGRRG